MINFATKFAVRILCCFSFVASATGWKEDFLHIFVGSFLGPCHPLPTSLLNEVVGPIGSTLSFDSIAFGNSNQKRGKKKRS